MNRETISITQAELAISQAQTAGSISQDAALSARKAIREKSYYGTSMTGADRARMLRLRFGIDC